MKLEIEELKNILNASVWTYIHLYSLDYVHTNTGKPSPAFVQVSQLHSLDYSEFGWFFSSVSVLGDSILDYGSIMSIM